MFAVTHGKPHPELRGVTVHRLLTGPQTDSAALQLGLRWPLARGETRATALLERFERFSRAARLVRLIQSLKPDIVHSLGIQGGGYAVLDAYDRLGSQLPPWIYSCWGCFGQFPEQEDHIRRVLRHCGYVTADCRRDLRVARELGFAGDTLGVFPGGGGFDLEEMRSLRQPGLVRSRRVIAVKGYQDHPPGARGLVVIEALRRCAARLHGYEVVVYSAAPQVRAAGEWVRRETGLPMTFLPPVPHVEMARVFGRARIAIERLGTSDGTPNTMLEAMIAGAFPIHSDTDSTREWIDDGRSGFLVPPEDASAVASAIARAAEDDALVDRADEINAAIADERLERSRIRERVIDMYRQVMAGERTPMFHDGGEGEAGAVERT